MNIEIQYIVISPAHNYVGHYGGPSGNHLALRKESVRLLAGHGIEGDRYALREAGHPKQITFFDIDALEAMAATFQCDVPPESVRRNVFVRGLDLPTLVGRVFSIGAVRFEGVDDCKPCFWMDEAIAPGAEDFLAGRGGLRARVLDDGELKTGTAEFHLDDSIQ